ncbi:MAG: hypothetical protein ACREKS_06820 [Candidatus Rokuibacteriota bacterium]
MKDSPADAIGIRTSTMLVNIGAQEVPLGGDIILSVDGISLVTILRAGQVLELAGRVP